MVEVGSGMGGLWGFGKLDKGGWVGWWKRGIGGLGRAERGGEGNGWVERSEGGKGTNGMVEDGEREWVGWCKMGKGNGWDGGSGKKGMS